MTSWFERLCGWLPTTTKNAEAIAHDSSVREVFKLRYWNFKSLLELNQRALDVMSEMELQARGSQPFGMPFIRSRVTALSVVVYQIIELLEAIAPGRHEQLRGAFDRIQATINSKTETVPEVQPGPLAVPLEGLTREDASRAGSKMAVLGEIKSRLGMRVPDGFVFTAWSYHRFMSHNKLPANINQQLQSTILDDMEMLYEVSRDLQSMIIAAELPQDILDALEHAADRMEMLHGRELLFSVRSSALGEDSPGLSFAGQYRTELDVPRSGLAQAYKRVIAGKYAARAIAYRHARGLRDEDVMMCVGVMVMIPAEAGGVTYSRDTSAPEADRVLINAVMGAAHHVVDGSASPTEIVLVPQGGAWTLLKRVPDASGAQESVMQEPVLKIEQAALLADVSRKLEEHFGVPQDTEWVFDRNGELHILQSRPLHPAEQHDVSQSAATIPRPDPLLHGGMCASPGAACGPARVVSSPEDAALVLRGDVLILDNALPRWAALLDKVSAVVAERGGAASHLATVSREYGIPALFNVGKDIQRIHSGQEITVDAEGRAVYAGCVEPLLQARKQPRPNLMDKSPVHRTLSEVLKIVAPLNLLHPESPGFTPHSCSTIHDIIRYCHEKAVQEMFAMGEECGFQRLAGKWLKSDVIMQWWFVDLGGGIRETEADTISLEDILSEPMHAVWDGITAVPWKGPPQPNASGFFSVMAQTTMNRELEVGAVTPGSGQGNCVFVSKNFCNINCRIGYHLSVVQAFLGENPRENYIRFSFKGGATDDRRKGMRLQLIGRVLETCNFMIRIKENVLHAHLDGYESSYLVKRLKVLGYLLMHTRQVDMIMTDPAQVDRIQATLLKDVAGFTESDEYA